jgi:hypothetical protein
MLVSLFPPLLDMLFTLFPPLLDTLFSLTPLSLPPPQIVSTKDARFVDSLFQHCKKVNQEKNEDKQVSSLPHHVVSRRICNERLIGECYAELDCKVHHGLSATPSVFCHQRCKMIVSRPIG